jgi:hypothetical protein
LDLSDSSMKQQFAGVHVALLGSDRGSFAYEGSMLSILYLYSININGVYLN